MMERAGSPDPYDFNFDEAWQMRTWHAARHLRRAKEKLRLARRAYDALAPNCPPEEREKAARRLSRAERREFKYLVAYWGGENQEPAPAPATGSSAVNPIVIE